MFKAVLPTIVAVVIVSGAPVVQGESLHFDYSDIVIGFDAGTSVFSISDHAASSLKATLTDGTESVADRADIADAASFDVWLSAMVVNPAGLDNISMGGSLTGTDINLGSPAAYEAAFANSMFGPDLDGIAFSGGILSVYGLLSPNGGPILADPAAGDWVFMGTGDAPTGAGSDGANNQFTIPESMRSAFTSGSIFALDIAIPTFGDGSSTNLAANGDEFFALAAEHGGFSSTGGDFKVGLVPEPATSLLLILGALMVGKKNRR